MKSMQNFSTTRTFLFYCTTLFCLSLIPTVSASVIVQGTRFIYPSDAKHINLQLSNEDAHPNIVQAWADIDNPLSDPETADAPFIITPPMFRMEPKTGQTVRMMLISDDLPQDRESIFYLNILQIPPRLTEHADRNQMLVMLRNRLKMFYRPPSIIGKVSDLGSQLRFHVTQEGQDWPINAHNPTDYYATLMAGEVQAGDRILVLNAEMLAPFSQGKWRIAKAGLLPDLPLRIRAALVDDYGAQNPHAFQAPRMNSSDGLIPWNACVKSPWTWARISRPRISASRLQRVCRERRISLWGNSGRMISGTTIRK